jgi:hypothetical protein
MNYWSIIRILFFFFCMKEGAYLRSHQQTPNDGDVNPVWPVIAVPPTMNHNIYGVSVNAVDLKPI